MIGEVRKMVFDWLFNLLTAPLQLLLELLPPLSVELPPDIMVRCRDIFIIVGYFLPLKTITAILSIKLTMWLFKITMALIVRIKSFVPTMGS